MESRARNSVLRAVSDDYESVDLILSAVQRLARIKATRQQVCQALSELAPEGLVQSYELSPKHPQATAVDIDPDRMKELWFYATPKGISLVRRWNRQLTTDN